MTLKERLKNIDIKLSKNHSTKLTNKEVDIIDTIITITAIEFAEWVDNIRVDRKILYDTSSIKELLEIFKKEKGL